MADKKWLTLEEKRAIQGVLFTALTNKRETITRVIPAGVALDADQIIAMACVSVMKKDIDRDIGSIVSATIDAATMGLPVDSRLGYFIPKGPGVVFRPSYLGLISIARRGDKIKDIYAREVFEWEVFEHGMDAPTFYCRHQPILDEIERGELVGVYGVLIRKDGTWIYDTMNKATLAKVASLSDRQGDNQFQEEMRKKAIIKRMLKSYGDDYALSAAIAADDEFFEFVEPKLQSGDTIPETDLHALTERLTEPKTKEESVASQLLTGAAKFSVGNDSEEEE